MSQASVDSTQPEGDDTASSVTHHFDDSEPQDKHGLSEIEQILQEEIEEQRAVSIAHQAAINAIGNDPPATEAPEEPSPDDDEEDEEKPARQKSLRFRPQDDEDAAYIQRSRETGIPVRELVRQDLAKASQPAPEPTEDAQQQIAAQLEELNEKFKAAAQARREAQAAFEDEKVPALEEAEEALRQALMEARIEQKMAKRQAEESQRIRADAEYQKVLDEFASNAQKAESYYPALADKESEFFQEAIAIEQVWKETGDPRFNQTDKVLLLAGIVAANRGIAPAVATAKSTPTTPVPTSRATQPKPKPAPLISAGTVRSLQAPPDTGAFDTEEDINAYIHNLRAEQKRS